MRKLLALLLVCVFLSGCVGENQPAVPGKTPAGTPEPAQQDYESRFEEETVIRLSKGAMDVTGKNSWSVFMSKDIVYYEDRDTYESGRPYGEGEDWERHSMDEANSHLVINITAPGAYRVTGQFPAGQIRVDLGEGAYDDENAVVELILDNAEITCTVAPAILFQNVYECDGAWDKDTAQPNVDTAAAGANLILRGENRVTGSHVAKIYKDKKGEKKLWKQDGAIYSYMSMNVYGPGRLDLTADNEGMDSELHLTVNGGDIRIFSDNDGMNANEEGVSVITVNGGSLRIAAGLGAEGDGIDSNGYLVINGGTVICAANPVSDAGLDSNLGSFIHGGTVAALGSPMDWAERESGQVTMNLQFTQLRQGAVTVTDEAGNPVFEFDPAADPVLGSCDRGYRGVILSCPGFRQGSACLVYQAGTQMGYTGTDVGKGPGGKPPAGPPQDGGFREPPEEGGKIPQGRPGETGQAGTVFYMQDKVNFFSGLEEAEQ